MYLQLYTYSITLNCVILINNKYLKITKSYQTYTNVRTHYNKNISTLSFPNTECFSARVESNSL